MTPRLGAATGLGQSYSEMSTQVLKVSNPSGSVSEDYASIWRMLPPIDCFLSHPFIWLSPSMQWYHQGWQLCRVRLGKTMWKAQLVISTIGLSPVTSELCQSPSVFPPSLGFYLLAWPWDFPRGKEDHIDALLLNVIWCLLLQDCLFKCFLYF